MIERFEILGSNSARPEAERIIFCDGTDGRLFQAETDLELSHWRPNRTPIEYRAGTSTETCFRWLDNPRSGEWSIAVNNHLDVDGIMSVYVLMHSDHALKHRQTIVGAAEMGDFWGCGEPLAQRVFQGVTQLLTSGGDEKQIYLEAFRRIPGLIDGTDPEVSQIEASLTPLRNGIELVRSGQIARTEIGSRLAHYIVPLTVASDDDARATYVPDFNEAISEKGVFWPQVRAYWDKQRVCLVSTERMTGWFHDLWFPGYHWADTEGLWRVPHFTFHDGMRSYSLNDSRLIAAFEALQRQESANGYWGLGGTRLLFGVELQSRFPLVGRFVDKRGNAAVSSLPPEHVAKTLDIFYGDAKTDRTVATV
jgi:hypothetical protein